MEAIAYLIGAGSMTLGVEAAGFTVREVWETPGYGKNARTWDLNRPANRHQVRDLDHNDTSHFSSRGGVDLIFGNPPCGGVSSMTCSRIDSPTNNCMRQWIRMVAPAQPRMILMENGYQLATDRMKPLLSDLTAVLDYYGYWYWTWMFYSYQVGCPQIRRRMFLCATLDRPSRPDFIALNDLPLSGDKSVAPIWNWIWDLAGVEPSPGPVTSRTGATVTQHWYHGVDALRVNEHIKKWPEWSRHNYLTPKDWAKIEQDSSKSESWKVKNKPRVWWDCPRDFAGMCMHRPSKMLANEAGAAIIGFYKFVHPSDNRVLTMREMARLMGYPDSWQFHELMPHLIAQGIPVMNARWAADRMLKVIGLR